MNTLGSKPIDREKIFGNPPIFIILISMIEKSTIAGEYMEGKADSVDNLIFLHSLSGKSSLLRI